MMFDFHHYDDHHSIPTCFAQVPPLVTGGHASQQRLPDLDVQRTTELWAKKGLIGHYGNSEEVDPSHYAKFLNADEGEIDFKQAEIVHHLRKKDTTNRILFTNALDNSFACFSKSHMCLYRKQPDMNAHPGFIFQKGLQSPGIVHVKLTDSTPGHSPWTFWDQTFQLGPGATSLPPKAPSMAGRTNIPLQSLCASPDGPHLYELSVEEQPPIGMKLPRSLTKRPVATLGVSTPRATPKTRTIDKEDLPPAAQRWLPADARKNNAAEEDTDSVAIQVPPPVQPTGRVPCTRWNAATQCTGAFECAKDDGSAMITPCDNTRCFCKLGYGKCNASTPCPGGLECTTDNKPLGSLCTAGDASCHCKVALRPNPVPLLSERIQFLVKETINECFCRPFGQGCEPDTYLPSSSAVNVDNADKTQEMTVKAPVAEDATTTYGPIKHHVGTIADPDPMAEDAPQEVRTPKDVITQPIEFQDDSGWPVQSNGTIPAHADNVLKM
eukprot:GEMP01049793.1.p1 GENE.GEMP01049793.1~~GEMP01049793.1.p1  ORF type:complete len:495 (+),score=110.49 GEMP01049793.1:147-1631(+)